MAQRIVEQNRDTAFAILGRLIGDPKDYFVSESTVAAVWAECERNPEIQRLTTNYVFGSFAKAESNLAKLEAKLIEVFRLKLPANK